MKLYTIRKDIFIKTITGLSRQNVFLFSMQRVRWVQQFNFGFSIKSAEASIRAVSTNMKLVPIFFFLVLLIAISHAGWGRGFTKSLGRSASRSRSGWNRFSGRGRSGRSRSFGRKSSSLGWGSGRSSGRQSALGRSSSHRSHTFGRSFSRSSSGSSLIRCKRGVKSSCSDGKGGKFAGGRANQPHVHYYDKRGDRGHVKIGNDKYDINDAYQVREAFRVVGERKPPNQVALQQEIQKVMKSLVKIGASGGVTGSNYFH